MRGRLRPSPWTPSSHTPGSGPYHVLPCAASWPYGPRPKAVATDIRYRRDLLLGRVGAGGTPLVRFSGPEMLRPQLLYVPLRHAEFFGHRRATPPFSGCRVAQQAASSVSFGFIFSRSPRSLRQSCGGASAPPARDDFSDNAGEARRWQSSISRHVHAAALLARPRYGPKLPGLDLRGGPECAGRSGRHSTAKLI